MNATAQEIVQHVEPQAPAVVIPQGDAVLSMIERAARDPNVDIDKFERLMAMKERMAAEQARRDFDEAIAAAKGEIGPIIKNRTVGFESRKAGSASTNYKHEDFAGIAHVVDPVLSRHGLSYRFRSKQDGKALVVTCILSKGGHFEETSLSAMEDHTGNKNSIQAIGSAATYLQRYTLKLALGLASAHDDDGKAASNTQTATGDSGTPEDLTREQVEVLQSLIVETGSDIQKFLTWLGVSKLAEIHPRHFQKAVRALEDKRQPQ